MKRHFFVLAAAVAFAVPSTSRAAGGAGRWSLSVQGGTDIEASGDYHDAAQGTVLGLPTTVEAKGYKDVYGRAFRGNVSLGYGVTPNIEVFGRGGYYGTTAKQLQVGNVAGLPLLADFSKYKEWGAEAGVRYYFSTAPFKPYVAGVAGVRFLSVAPATFSVPAANVVLTDLPFYDKSTVGVFGADLGASYDLSHNVAIGVEAGLRYQTKPSGIDTGLAGTGLEKINDVASRWSVPILGQITFRF
jgi:hypothetical protein